jgi:hypothetical protein
VCFNIEHYDESAEDDDGDILEAEDQYYKVNGQTYRCTGAHVRFGITNQAGVSIRERIAASMCTSTLSSTSHAEPDG